MQKNCSKKNIKYSKNQTILKINHNAKTIAHAKSPLWVKNYNSKNNAKIQSTNHLVFFFCVCVQKTAPKKTKYSGNEIILRIGNHAKAVAQAKSSLWVQNYNSKKHVKIHSTIHLGLFCSKKRSQKNTKYSRNEIILKIGHNPKAIAHAKSCLWVQIYNSKKHVKIHSKII